VLPVEVRELPDDLARLDRVLSDDMLLFPIAQAWQDSARERGRPSIAMTSFVRLMVIKQRTGWGYETLVREVSDSLHLRRFCLIGIDQRVPDESTVRKLARRLGASVVQEITRLVIEKAQRETRFTARAARIDSTVVEADIRYPSDAMLALQGARALAREGKKLQKLVGSKVRVRDRSRSVGKTVRAISKTLARRSGEAKAQGLRSVVHAIGDKGNAQVLDAYAAALSELPAGTGIHHGFRERHSLCDSLFDEIHQNDGIADHDPGAGDKPNHRGGGEESPH